MARPVAPPQLPVVGVYDGATNAYLFHQSLTSDGPAQSLPQGVDYPCLALPPEACGELRSYSGIVVLPENGAGYWISYQVCCRMSAVVNVVDPAQTGLSLLLRIPATPSGNGSPRFSQPPPVGLCLGEPFVFDHSATGPDGHELVYELCTPYVGGSVGGPNSPGGGPNPTPSGDTRPPYANITWSGGSSNGYPIPSDPAISIDPATGVLSFTPTQLGRYVIGVCVSEYLDGELLSTVMRDHTFFVVVCVPGVTAFINTAVNGCTGSPKVFHGWGNTTNDFLWDFGDPDQPGVSSTETSPTWTYTSPGARTVTLIAAPGTPCADTAQVTVHIHATPEPPFAVPAMVCANSTVTLALDEQTGTDAGALWELGPGAQPTTATGHSVEVAFLTAGEHPVTVSVTENGCTGIHAADVLVDACLGVAGGGSSTRLAVMPNPFHGEAWLLLDLPVDGTVEVLDATGRRLWAQRLPSSTDRLPLPLSEAAPGSYLLRLTGDDGRVGLLRLLKL